MDQRSPSALVRDIPPPVLAVSRGIGQVFFQDNALSGICFVVGLAFSSPMMAFGAVVGSIFGFATAWVLKYDRTEIEAGIFGFNSTLVGIATLFFFRPGAASLALLMVGCVVATVVTRLMRRHVPVPTYTTPFIVTTWAVFFLGKAMGATATDTGYGPLIREIPLGFVGEATLHGVGQVMFQASVWTGILFLIGIGVSNWRHAAWVLVGGVAGMLVASYHVAAGADSIDPERLIPRSQFDNIRLGLYGYNATLAAVALYLGRKRLIAPLLGILISVPITEYFPRLGLPALTAPFVLATWVVLALGWCEEKYLDRAPSPAP